MTMKKSKNQEEFIVDGKDVIKFVKKVIKEGNARRIIIKDEKNKTLMEIPLTFAAVGAVIAPVLAAIGAMAAIITKCKIVVIKKK
jgi:hypothetical protein